MGDTNEERPTRQQICAEVIKLTGINFFRHGVGQNAAALAYFLLFSIFPLLIFISNLVGLLSLDVNSITVYLAELLPREVTQIIEEYFAHVNSTSSSVLMLFAFVFSVWFPFRAVRGMMLDIRRAYRQPTAKRQVVDLVKQLICTLAFIFTMTLTFFLTVAGERLITWFIDLLPANTLNISGYILTLWQYLRFLPIAILMIFTIGMLYAASLDRMLPIRSILPGIGFAVFFWLLVSAGFSFYLENFSHYTTIYGTLGTVVVLLIWLYFTAAVLIMGAEFNAALFTVLKKNNLDGPQG